MDIIIALLVGVVLGIGIMILYIAYKFKTILNQLDEYIDRAIDATLMGVIVEKHGEMYRFYNEKDGQFILQTETLDGLNKEFNKLYPTKTCYVSGGDPTAVEELKSVLAQRD